MSVNIATSPCEILSPFVSNNLVRTKCQNFEKVRTDIHNKLSSLSEITFSYNDKFQAFICDMKHESSFRSYEIDCYWDPKQNEHVIDIRRTLSGGFYRFNTNLIDEINKLFDESYIFVPLQPISDLTQFNPLI